MNRRPVATWAAVLALAGLTATGCRSGPGGPTTPGGPVMPRANVLLVTIDTLRADVVGTYGHPGGLTPQLDRLAAAGARFETAYAHVPLTLPSHTSLMTGAYPFVNGVRDNGSFRFDGGRPTLATALKNAGYRTGAFVASFVLDARFGLNAGFDVYDGATRPRTIGGELSVLERPADEVVTAALGWLGTPAPSPAPWFAWVHFYDPHDPYEAPEPFRTRFSGDPYAGEVAFADAELGRLLDALRERGLLDRTLVVVAADHGESLGEHQERTHGLFAYDATLRVPLVVWGPPGVRAGVIQGPARLVDVMPTVLDVVGVAGAAASGRSLVPSIASGRIAEDPGVYFEALNANLTRHWAPLTGLIAGGLKFIDLPLPELYDLAADPSESRNLFEARRADATPIARRLNALKAGAAPAAPQPVDRETERRLRALGYVASSAPAADRAYTDADDPKRLIGLHTSLEDALAALKAGRAPEAERLLTRLIEARADFTVAYDRLAQLYRDTGRLRQAIATLDRAAKAGAADAGSLAALGGYLQETGDLARSIEVLEAARQLNPSEMEVYEKLGVTYTRTGRFADAHRMFDHLLSVAPNSATTLNNQGSLLLTERRWAEAAESLKKAIAIDPGMANAHNGLGVVYAQQGDFERAIAEWQQALTLRPDLRDARDNIAKAKGLLGRTR
ncbi:MAG: sulfatase-like hydrolase/transferase [Vicinamibacterales bacterium]